MDSSSVVPLVWEELWLRSSRMMRKTRFWRYERRISFFVSRREIPFGGGVRDSGSGNDKNADVSESVSVERRAGKVAAVAIMGLGNVSEHEIS